MAREKEGYRDNLELIKLFIINKYGDERRVLSNSDIQEFTGLSYEYVRKNFMHNERYVSIAVFARDLCPDKV